MQWSTAFRIVGFETQPEKGEEGPGTPQTCWVICDGIPICVATEKLRPSTAPELLAYQYMQGKDYRPPAVSETQAQQSFIDERDEIPPLVSEEHPDPYFYPKRPKTSARSRGAPVEQRSPGDEKDEETDDTSDEEPPSSSWRKEKSQTPGPIHGVDPEELRASPEPMREIEDQYPWLR